MLRKIFTRAHRPFDADNENAPHAPAEFPEPRNVRALATGAALAASVDPSPAVLVTIYDYAHRYRDRPRRAG